ncbi:FMN-binding protein [Microbacterium sp. C7(2022)]|uniref:FMN-binding protein n=1 Tax=Microbacterium sp. C7(2022) TaxID=2992759 RepID=UPI00237A347F|nr:FMN-binding protein [Microbacterium sp. C7(2022)]MDE0545813.1 FMN-binding protein [Microbacterium sp. C7(2022)]
MTARTAAAFAAIAGVAVLAGCGATDSSTESVGTDTGSSTSDSTSSGSGSYVDGTYTAEGSYATPESVETIEVTVTLVDDVVTDVAVTGDPQKRESEQYQAEFIGGIADVVVGQDIDELSVSRVAGSSLTSAGFNQAIEAIKSDAAQ